MVNHFHHRRFRHPCPRPARDERHSGTMKTKVRQSQRPKKAHPVNAGENAFLCWERPEDILPRVHELLDHIADGGVNLYGERPFSTTFRPVDHDFLGLPVHPRTLNRRVRETESGMQSDVETLSHPVGFVSAVDRNNLRIRHFGFKSRLLAFYAEFARRIVCSESARYGLVHDKPQQFKLTQGGIKLRAASRFFLHLGGAPINVSEYPCPIEMAGAGNLGFHHVGTQPIPVNPVDVRRTFLGRVTLPEIVRNPVPRCVALLRFTGEQARFHAIDGLRYFQRLIRVVFADRGFQIPLRLILFRKLNPNVRTVSALVSREDHNQTVARRSKVKRILSTIRVDSEGLGNALSLSPYSLGCWFDSNAVQAFSFSERGLQVESNATVANQRSKQAESRSENAGSVGDGLKSDSASFSPKEAR